MCVWGGGGGVSHDSRITEWRVDLRWWWYQCSERGRRSLLGMYTQREDVTLLLNLTPRHTHIHTLTHSQSKGTHDRRAAYSTHIKTWKAIDRSAKTLSEKRFKRVKHFKSQNDKILQYITLLITIELFLLEIQQKYVLHYWSKFEKIIYIYIYIYILVLCSN